MPKASAFGRMRRVRARDLTPEGIEFAPHGELWVTLQQNNAIAVILVDKQRMKIKRLISLGAKDHSLNGNGLDASDMDGEIKIRPTGPFSASTRRDEIDRFTSATEPISKPTSSSPISGDPTDIPVNGVLADETMHGRSWQRCGKMGSRSKRLPKRQGFGTGEELGKAAGSLVLRATPTTTAIRTCSTLTVPARSQSWTTRVTSCSTSRR